MVFGTLNQLFVKTGAIWEKRISQTVMARYRGFKQITITHGYFFLFFCTGEDVMHVWVSKLNQKRCATSRDIDTLRVLGFIDTFNTRWTSGLF